MTKIAAQAARVVLKVLAVLLLVGCGDEMSPAPVPLEPAPASAGLGTPQPGRLSVLGTIVPARRIACSFATSAWLRAVHVQVGMEVRTGDVLAELEVADLELAVQEAEDRLAFNLALLEQARAGARPQELAIAQAEYQGALAQHEQLLAGVRSEEIAAAEADYRAALAQYEQVKAGVGREDLIAAQAAVEKAEIALKRAQAAYDLVAGQPDVAARMEAVALHEATIDHRAAKARYDQLKNLPNRAALQEAEAQLARAQAQLQVAKAGPTEHEIAASAKSVAIAQAQLELIRAGPRPEDVAVAEAEVRQARTTLEQARLARSRSQLLAPFAGTISAVYLSPGEWAGSGVPVVGLLDTSRWQVETRNVGELNIGRVRVGQEAIVRVIALGHQRVRGQVVAISPVAVVQQGDTTYTVFIELEPTDLNLWPGMNAEVEILTE
jgi:HlyD family secretion protein